MFRAGVFGFLSFLATMPTALAETPVERGQYLVNSILACGNCHTPKTASGEPIADKELSGGLVFTTPAFDATASNITPDRDTGIGTWSDAEIKQAITEGIRPNHGRLAGVPLAAVMPVNFYKAMLPRDLDAVVAYLRSVKPVHNEGAGPVYKAPVHRDAYPDAENGFTEAALRDPIKQGAYLVTLLHGMPFHLATRGFRSCEWSRQGRQTICTGHRKRVRDHVGRCEGKKRHIAQDRRNRRFE
jgi:mono/diheme cytochrome c family protein